MRASLFFDDDETGKISNTLSRVTKELGEKASSFEPQGTSLFVWPPSVADDGMLPTFDIPIDINFIHQIPQWRSEN